MSARDPFGGDPEDLGVRARRGLLGRGEQRELERATESSASLRIAYEIGRDMDGVTAVRGGDDALIASAASAALARGASAPVSERATHVPARARGRRMLGAAIVAGVVLVSGVAAALWSGIVTLPLTRSVTTPTQAPALRQPQRAARRAHVPNVAASQVPNPTEVAAPITAITPIAAPVKAATPARRSNAAELFHAANAARRDGDFTRAARLYAELRAGYPESDEGELARVSLGQLWLARGQAAAAEREFRRYLARGRGQLTEEALVGQAQSLLRLGKAQQERASLQRLLADFPHSVYAAAARVRLAALEHEDATSAH